MSEPIPIDFGEYVKNRNSVRVISLEFFPQIANFWSPGFQYAVDAIVRPNKATGFAYQATAGQSGDVEPRWPTRLGLTVSDGSVVWTCIAAGANGVQSLTSPVLTSEPDSGLTVGTPTVANGEAQGSQISFSIEDGDLGGYDLSCQVSAGSETLVGRLRVTVK